MSIKVKKVVSTHCYDPSYFYGDLHTKSLVVWPVSTASYLLQHAYKILRYMYTLEDHVLWLDEDSAGFKIVGKGHMHKCRWIAAQLWLAHKSDGDEGSRPVSVARVAETPR